MSVPYDFVTSLLQSIRMNEWGGGGVVNVIYSSHLFWVLQGFAESHAAKFCAEENMSETDTPTQVITLAFTGWTLWYV